VCARTNRVHSAGPRVVAFMSLLTHCFLAHALDTHQSTSIWCLSEIPRRSHSRCGPQNCSRVAGRWSSHHKRVFASSRQQQFASYPPLFPAYSPEGKMRRRERRRASCLKDGKRAGNYLTQSILDPKWHKQA